MLNILVTGSKGFIGKNLLKKLDSKKYNILQFHRDDTKDTLEKFISLSDFIVHLAAQVKPNSSDEDFKNSNTRLTQTIIEMLKQNSKHIPILMASTTHAKLIKNSYGKTKRDAEILVERYIKETKTKCFIYRLPHLFGEGCKPNYNSVISTWIYNSIHDFEIKVFDRDMEMHYAYVQDIVDEFISTIESKTSKELYIQPKRVYQTNLGEVMDFLTQFKQNIKDNNYKIYDEELKQKLFTTYIDYYRNRDAR